MLLTRQSEEAGASTVAVLSPSQSSRASVQGRDSRALKHSSPAQCSEVGPFLRMRVCGGSVMYSSVQLKKEQRKQNQITIAHSQRVSHQGQD